jgi:hypothetical protein
MKYPIIIMVVLFGMCNKQAMCFSSRDADHEEEWTFERMRAAIPLLPLHENNTTECMLSSLLIVMTHIVFQLVLHQEQRHILIPSNLITLRMLITQRALIDPLEGKVFAFIRMIMIVYSQDLLQE